MTEASVKKIRVRGKTGEIAVFVQGAANAPAVVMTHSILSSHAMWDEQADLLVQRGLQVIRIDTIGHGESSQPSSDVSMDTLGDDVIAVLDSLNIAAAHFVGLSLGGMYGLGLHARHAKRLLSLIICDARADAPPEVAAPWDERISLVQLHASCEPLAEPTIRRWFGDAFVLAQPMKCQKLQSIAASTSVSGFVACARAIQRLDYLQQTHSIKLPVTLVVGANDGVLPAAMQALQRNISGSQMEVISGAGHLPNVDQTAAFNAAMLAHFDRLGV